VKTGLGRINAPSALGKKLELGGNLIGSVTVSESLNDDPSRIRYFWSVDRWFESNRRSHRTSKLLKSERLPVRPGRQRPRLPALLQQFPTSREAKCALRTPAPSWPFVFQL